LARNVCGKGDPKYHVANVSQGAATNAPQSTARQGIFFSRINESRYRSTARRAHEGEADQNTPRDLPSTLEGHEGGEYERSVDVGLEAKEEMGAVQPEQRQRCEDRPRHWKLVAKEREQEPRLHGNAK
jgi:hypothetical protein